MIIKAKNNITVNAPYTYLSNGEAVGAGTLRVRNINNFSPSWAIQIGKTGEELAEIGMLTGGVPSGTSLLTTGTTRYPHPTDTPVYAIKYDKIIFKRSTAGTAGTAVALSNGTLPITPDSDFTAFDDTSGVAAYAYKVTYYNSVTAEVSNDSDWLTSTGFSFYSLARIRDRIKRKLYSSNYIKDDQTINDWVNEWVESMNNVAIDVNKDYAMGSTNIAFAAGQERGTITDADFKEARRIWMTTDGVSYYLATRMDLTGFIPQDTWNETHPYFYYAGDNVIGRKPTDSAGTASIEYYKLQSVLTNDTDELPVSMHAYTKSFTDYALAQAYYLDLKETLGDKFEQKAKEALEVFRMQITPRAKTGPVSMMISEVTTGDDDLELVI